MELVLTSARIDLESGRVTRGEASLHLTPSERQLLAFLVRHPRTPVARQTLLQSVWGYDKKVQSRTLDTTVKTLRKKVERDPRQPDHLRTVRGVGYRFVPHVVSADTLVGRAEGLQALLSAVGRGHVVTLAGVAGVGKTTLGREALRHLRGVFAGLGAAVTEAQVVQAVATALSLDASVDDAEALGAHLARLDLDLLVIDNGEQAREALSRLLPAWSERVAVLVTSRVPLGMPGEQVLPLEGLGRPDAVDLLRRQVGASYADADADLLGAIVDRVDRLPLGIELVAARARWLAPAEVLERLADPTTLLPAGPGRHGSMEAALAWSFEALTEGALAALSACGVFAGAFDVPSVEAVLDRPAGPVVDTLGELVDAGWLRREADGALAMLVLLRAYVQRRIPPSDILVRRAAEHLVAKWGDAVGRRCLRWRDTARALAAQHAGGRPALAAELELMVVAAYASTGPTDARCGAADRAVGLAPEGGLRAKALLARAEARDAAGHGASLDDLDEARGHAEAVGDDALLGRILGRMGTVHFLRGALDTAEPLLEQALALHVSSGDLPAQADRHANMANVALRQGRFDAAQRRFLEALALHEQVGNALSAAKVMSNLGIVHLHLKRPERARRWYRQAEAAHTALGHAPGLVRVRANLAVLDHQLGQLAQADETFAAVAVQCRDLGEPLLLGIAWLNRACIAIERQDAVAGERCVMASRVALEQAQAAGYLGLLDMIEVLVDWLDGPDPDALEAAIAKLPAANGHFAAVVRGLLVAEGRVASDPPEGLGGAPLLVRWLEVCGAGDVGALDAFVVREAAEDTELRMVAAVLRHRAEGRSGVAFTM